MILRAKVQWIEEGEKPTHFFASLEKKNYINKLINKLNIEGNIIQNQKSILQETSNFYQNLYRSIIVPEEHNNHIDMFLNNNFINKLTEQQKQECEGNISIEEIKCAIKHMKHDKTPGIDGLPVEFYNFFWKEIGHFLVRSIRGAYLSGVLSIS